jgi:hypothetical protein
MYIEENIITYLITLAVLLYSINNEVYSLLILGFVAYVFYFNTYRFKKSKISVNDTKLQEIFNYLKKYETFNKKKYYRSIKKINKFLKLINNYNTYDDIVKGEYYRNSSLNDLSSIGHDLSGNNENILNFINNGILNIKKITDSYLLNVKKQLNLETYREPYSHKKIFSINSPKPVDKNYFTKYELY